jgi:DNA-binding Xre family transcriptional regulator
MQTKKMTEFSFCTIMSTSGILIKVQNLETICDALTSTQYYD